MRDFEMKLPDPVFAFKLLDGSNISDSEVRFIKKVQSITQYE